MDVDANNICVINSQSNTTKKPVNFFKEYYYSTHIPIHCFGCTSCFWGTVRIMYLSGFMIFLEKLRLNSKK